MSSHPERDGPSQEPAEISGLLNLPSRGLFIEGAAIKNHVGTYLATHDRTKAPPDQNISTDSSTEAFIRMLKRRDVAAAAAGAGKKGTAGVASGAKRAHDSAGSKADEQQPKKKPALGLAAGLSALAAKPGPSGIAAHNTHAANLSAKHASNASGSEPGPSTRPAAATTAEGSSRPAPGKSGAAAPAAPAPASLSAAAGTAPLRAAAVALAAAVVQGGGAGAGAGTAAGGARRTFTQDELKAKAVKDLKELCKARGLLVSGTKDQLMSRITEYQRRAMRAAQPT